MASAFSHGLVAIAIGKLLRMSPVSIRFWVLSIFCSVIPDIDIIGYRVGIDYGDLFGHRGLTHSLAFAGVFSVVVVRLGFPAVKIFSGGWWVFMFHFFLVTASHGVLDAMTDGGLGVAFFAPLDHTRYFLPWTPVRVSPLGVRGFFTMRGWDVMVSEVVWIWVPVLLILGGFGVCRRIMERP